MSTYRTTCENCGDTYETESWVPLECPFCELYRIKQSKEKLPAIVMTASAVTEQTTERLQSLIRGGVQIVIVADKDFEECIKIVENIRHQTANEIKI